jgi:hypothetical protein
MTTSARVGLCGLFAACLALAASPNIEVSGNYVEARTADVYTGACFANSEVQLVGNLAVFGWQINKGAWKGVSLDGLGVAAAVKANTTLGSEGDVYPVKSILMVDQRASLEQREALKAFARYMTGDLLQDIVRVDAIPIEFKIDGDSIHSARVSFSAGTLLHIQTRGIEERDNHCSHEVTWYPPLAKTDHAMPAVALDNRFDGKGLNTTWSSPDKRSAFVATFHVSE